MWSRIQAWWYLRQVSWELPGRRKQKRKILEGMKACVQDFLSENPDAGYADMVHRFGSAERIAESYVSEMEIPELLQQMQIRQRICYFTMVIITVLAIIRGGLTIVAYIDHFMDMQGYATVEVIVIDETVFEEGD